MADRTKITNMANNVISSAADVTALADATRKFQAYADQSTLHEDALDMARNRARPPLTADELIAQANIVYEGLKPPAMPALDAKKK